MIPPWLVQSKICEESSGDATSAKQERRSKLCASWSEQNQAKDWEKFQETREGQNKARVRSLQPGP